MTLIASVELRAPVRTIALSRDGARVAAGAGSTLVQIDGRTGRIVEQTAQRSRVDAVEFTTDGTLLAIALRNERVLVVQTESNDIVASVRSGHSGYHELAWSGASLLAAGHYEPFVAIFDVTRATRVHLLNPDVFDDQGRTAVVFSSTGDVLATTAYNKVLLWQGSDLLALGNKKVVKRLVVRGDTHLIDATFARGDSELIALAVSRSRASCHAWTVETGQKLRTLRLPRSAARIACSDRVLAIGDEAETDGVTLWTVGFQPLDLELPSSAGESITALGMSRDGAVLAAGTRGGKVLLWTLEGVMGKA